MAEFRRASNEFRMQMEEELRIADQEEQRKKIAAMEAAAPVTPAITDGSESTIAPATGEFLVGHPHEQPQLTESQLTESQLTESHAESSPAESRPEPLPIATSGDLNLMPPSTGLPVSNSALSPMLESIPHDPDPETAAVEAAPTEVAQRG
jgi:sec-independent protein translocase protein TatB